MSRRYFYTDPLAAAWMAQKHNLKLIANLNSIGNHYELFYATSGAPDSDENLPDERYYIHPDSLPLLEPEIGDVLSTPPGIFGRCAFLNVTEEWLENSRHEASPDLTIIQRNGKAFMWPECDNG